MAAMSTRATPMPAERSPWRAVRLAACVYVMAALALATGCAVGEGNAGAGGFAAFGGAGSTGGFGGVGGFSGAGGFGGVGGVGFFDAGQSCGHCPAAPPGAVGAFVPCCLPAGGCGYSSNGLLFEGCLPRHTLGFTTNDCPDGLLLGAFPASACCTAPGRCGLALDMVGLGCVDDSLLSYWNAGFTGPVSLPCGPSRVPDAGSDLDAGGNACDDATLRCGPHTSCTQTAGYYACECLPGYRNLSNSDRLACGDINECLAAGACPEGTCVNTEGGYRCEPATP